MAVAHTNLLHNNFRNLLVSNRIVLSTASLDLQGTFFQKVDKKLLRGLRSPSRRHDVLLRVHWIHVHQNFVELAQPEVPLPWIVHREAAAATEMVQQLFPLLSGATDG